MRSNVIHLHGCTAATATGQDLAATTGQDLAALQAHQTAENALAMALHYLRASASNIPGATRKAVQALDALNTLHTLAPVTASNHKQSTGRA